MNWQKQIDKPLFESLIWSKPERKSLAGKLLIVGGNKFEFNLVQEGHQYATEAEIGETKIVLPKPLQQIVGQLEDVYFLPATEGGSFSEEGFSELLGFAEWADVVLIAGEISRNSETVLMLRKFVAEWNGRLVLTHDAIDQIAATKEFGNRSNTMLVGGLGQFQRLGPTVGSSQPIKFSDNLELLVKALSKANRLTAHTWVTAHDSWLSCFEGDSVISTKLIAAPSKWRSQIAAWSSVNWAQNPTKSLESVATATYEYAKTHSSGKTLG